MELWAISINITFVSCFAGTSTSNETIAIFILWTIIIREAYVSSRFAFFPILDLLAGLVPLAIIAGRALASVFAFIGI